MNIDATDMCSHLQRKFFAPDGEYRAIREQIESDPTLTAVVRSRQLLNTPENLLGRAACLPYTDESHTALRSPDESYRRILAHLQAIRDFAKQILIKKS